MVFKDGAEYESWLSTTPSDSDATAFDREVDLTEPLLEEDPLVFRRGRSRFGTAAPPSCDSDPPLLPAVLSCLSPALLRCLRL